MDGGNAENAGAVFGHALKHAGLSHAAHCDARLALRRKSDEQIYGQETRKADGFAFLTTTLVKQISSRQLLKLSRAAKRSA